MSSPEANQPRISIILNGFNQLEQTRVCVESLWLHPPQIPWELLIVDQCSPDGGTQWLAEQERAEQERSGRLRVVSAQENLSIAQARNRGTAAAQGEYLLFLDPDLLAQPGWLDPLVAVLDRDPNTGIVGAKLLFPEGNIRNAGMALIDNRLGEKSVLGGIILSYQKPSDWPGAQASQTLQIVTGGCMLVRGHAFQSVGGFDERYSKNLEDLDFCLQVAEAGWQTVFQPESTIVSQQTQNEYEDSIQEPNQADSEHFNRVWLGRAEADFIKHDSGDFQRTEHRGLRPYIIPRTRLSRPSRVERSRDRKDHQPTASVIVLTWNALSYTKLCAESLLTHTDPRHELIFVDNGSRTDTIEYLEQLSSQNDQVRVLFNGENLGFAAGNNTGIAAAKGDYICLLNSDTVVTEKWLEKLISPAEADPNVGLVGPVTNSITGGQCLPMVSYDKENLHGLAEFAAQRAEQFAGRADPALWIVGFCLLIRRELIERIGGLDERFGQGNYEDTDYCLRAVLAHYHSAVAQDCFIHHFGGRSFADGAVDYATQIDEKFEIFCAKWHLDPSVRGTGNLDPETLAAVEYIPPLHFHPLPVSKTIKRYPPEQWEVERWLTRGEQLFQSGLLPQAEALFRAILIESPTCSRAENNLACTLWQQAKGEVEAETSRQMLTGATATLESLLTREPGNENAQWNLKEIAKEQALAGVSVRDS